MLASVRRRPVFSCLRPSQVSTSSNDAMSLQPRDGQSSWLVREARRGCSSPPSSSPDHLVSWSTVLRLVVARPPRRQLARTPDGRVGLVQALRPWSLQLRYSSRSPSRHGRSSAACSVVATSRCSARQGWTGTSARPKRAASWPLWPRGAACAFSHALLVERCVDEDDVVLQAAPTAL